MMLIGVSVYLTQRRSVSMARTTKSGKRTMMKRGMLINGCTDDGWNNGTISGGQM